MRKMNLIIYKLCILLYFVMRLIWGENRETLEYLPFAIFAATSINWKLYKKEGDIYLYGFGILSLASMIWANDIERAAIENIFIAIALFTYYSWTISLRTDVDFLKYLKWYVYVSISLIPIGIVTANDTGDGEGRFFLGMQSSASGWAYAATIFFSFLLYKKTNDKKFILLLIFGLAPYAINQSFRVVLSIIIFGFVYALIEARSKILKSIIIFTPVIVALVALNNSDENNENRFDIYIIGAKTIYENPEILDYGIEKGFGGSEVRATLAAEGLRYLSKEIDLLGAGIGSSYKIFEDRINYRAYSHNNEIDLLMNLGVIGFVLYYYFYYGKIKTSQGMVRSLYIAFFVTIIMAGIYGGKTYNNIPILLMFGALNAYTNLNLKRLK